MTLFDLIDDLTAYLNLTPEQQFRVAAKIKRYTHDEKASVYSRNSMYAENSKDTDWLAEINQQKAEGHRKMSKLPDEEVITFNIGNFKYVQKIPPCSVCGVELTGKSYTSTYNQGEGYKTFCPTHAPVTFDEDEK